MIKDAFTGEVAVGDYELGEGYRYSCSKLLDKESKYKWKCTDDYSTWLRPYSEMFSGNAPTCSFNNKKFSII